MAKKKAPKKAPKKKAPKKKAPKKAPKLDSEDDLIPLGKVDEDGDELLDLYDEKDDLTDDVIIDLDKIEDDMLADETEEEEFGPEIDEIVSMLRMVKCGPCKGSSTKKECTVRHDYSCPPDKAKK